MTEIKNYRITGGKHCFLIRTGPLLQLMRNLYKRDNICLKIFDEGKPIENENDLKTFKWGDDPKDGNPRVNTTLWEATQIQNIAAWHGLAPRIYGIETVRVAGKLCPMQVAEYVKHDPSQNNQQASDVVYKKVKDLGKEYKFAVDKEDVSKDDAVGNLLIDFQTFEFTKPYQKTVREIYCEKGRYGKVYYQNEEGIGLHGGPRKSEQRIKELGLDQIKFNGNNSVIDIGCAGGFFCRYAYSKGAADVQGFDLPEIAEAAMHVNNYLGFWNIDIFPGDVTKFQPSPDQVDIVFMLSMNYHIPIPDWIQHANLVVFEDNGKETRNFTELGKPWTDWFSNITFIGKASDHGDKPIYHLRK